MAGRSLPHVMAMLIPEAWDADNTMPAEKRAFHEYHASLMEPWDGPAAVAFTDGRKIGATLDRNGLRPARYLVTKDGLLIMASETGVLGLAGEATFIPRSAMMRATVPSVSGALRSADRLTPRLRRASAALPALGSSVPNAVAMRTANCPTVVPFFAGAAGAAYAAATSPALNARTTNAFVFMIRSLPSAS